MTLPPGVEAPALGPLTGGTWRGVSFFDRLAAADTGRAFELATLRIAPRLRMVPGVVEVNTWGGAERRLEVRADPLRFAARGLTLDGLAERLRQSIGATAGFQHPGGRWTGAFARGLRPQKPEDPGALLLWVSALAHRPQHLAASPETRHRRGGRGRPGLAQRLAMVRARRSISWPRCCGRKRARCAARTARAHERSARHPAA